MPDPHAPLRRPKPKPAHVEKPEVSETEAPERDFPEGQLPRMPASHDPLLNPGLTPSETDHFPQD